MKQIAYAQPGGPEAAARYRPRRAAHFVQCRSAVRGVFVRRLAGALMRISALLLPLNSSMRQVFFLLLAMAANFAAVPPAAAYWRGGDTGMSLSIGAGN